MQNSISNSQFDLDLANFGNGNIVIDMNTIALLLIFVALLLLSIAIFSYVRYKRDKDNVPSLHRLEKKVDFYSLDFIRMNNRLQDLEDKSGNIDELHKSILELKSLIQRRKDV